MTKFLEIYKTLPESKYTSSTMCRNMYFIFHDILLALWK